MGKKIPQEADLSTEEKIKEAARKVFTQKGYAATRTRDIAEEAGLNLALLNYYFRSKEKLFEIIMIEKMQKFFGMLAPVFNDSTTDLDKKIEVIASKYIDLIRTNPDLPLFVLSEVRNAPVQFANIIKEANFFNESVFMKQIKAKRPDIHPLHFLVSLMGMCVFPFVMKPVLQIMTNVKDKAFDAMMVERKKLIPVWTKAMLKAK